MKNIFKQKTTWSNAEFIPLKLSIAFAYIIIGSYFQDFFRQHYTLLFILFLITVSWALYLWFKKMKQGGN
jgi:hypothetical protein